MRQPWLLWGRRGPRRSVRVRRKALESQPGLRFTFAGDISTGAGCGAIIGSFLLDTVPLSEGGSFFRVIKECISPTGLTVAVHDQAADCTAWLVELPGDVRPVS